jgi:hypothetical protein
VFYPEGLVRGHLRHHGDRAAREARRPVREDRLMAGCHESPPLLRPARPPPADHAALLHAIIMAAAGRAACRTLRFLSVFLMKVLCFALFACAFNLLLGYGGLLSFGHAAYFGGASYVSAHAAKSLGADAGIAILLGTGRRAARPRHRFARHPPAGHLLRHDHAGLRADGLLLRAAGASSPAARTASRRCRAAISSAAQPGNDITLYYVVRAASSWPACC